MKFNIKNIVKEIVIFVLIIFVASNIISYMRKPSLDSEQIPSLDVVLLDGSKFNKVEGKALVVHFWADWCKVCSVEAQNIETISKEYEVLTIAVNSGSDEKIKAYMREKNLTFKVLNDNDGKWAEKFKVQVFPTTFIYNSQENLKFTEVGYTTTAGLVMRLKI